MKKNFLLTICILFISFVSFAGKFVIIPVTPTQNLETLFADQNLKINYYCDHYVLATTDVLGFAGTIVLDENAFADVSAYAIVYCFESQKENYLAGMSKKDKVLYSGDDFLVMKILSNDFMPAKNDGMVAIRDVEAKLSKSTFDFPVITEQDETILDWMSQISTESLLATVQTLENFETRFCSHPNSVLAQNWIKEQYDALDLEVFIHQFSHNPWWGGTCLSHNVIAIQYGTEFPDEYIVCGGHYDSFSYNSSTGSIYLNDAPGADDNATGTAGVLETARILSQYDFKRSIIYCAFSAEESGLWGSDYYAQKCKNQGMNIIGYFNIDMSGYLAPETNPHIDLIHPATAAPLANYYKNVATIYFPEIPVTSYSGLSGGDSDHTSFNKYGFLGIFPFEDRYNYTPYIHSPNDKIGPSLNNPEQMNLFTQLNLASIATLAVFDKGRPKPTNCLAEYNESSGIQVSWEAPETELPVDYYVYRNGVKLLQTGDLQLIDSVEDYYLFCYKITAVYNIDDELIESGFSNESCTSMPIPVPTNCVAQYIGECLENQGCIQITWDAPEGNTPEGYNLYRDSTLLASSFTEHSYRDDCAAPGLHCYFVEAIYNDVVSDPSNSSCDSISITHNIIEYHSNYKIYPNPTNGELRITNYELRMSDVEVFDMMGKRQKAEGKRLDGEFVMDVAHLPEGVYFIRIKGEVVGKFVKN
ncbi:MAG: M20/M25/M40 family metallo-hydrolase [Lentimicrobiaceae bacterium]|nr:M20/M25/M40 family metallo-hydrolase [Lentimicrobiaceae bacterium]